MPTLLIENLPCEADPGFDLRPSIGLIVLSSDQTIEDEFRFIVEKFPAVRLQHSRIANLDSITRHSLADMQNRITDCAALLAPNSDLDVIAYGCTSASMTIGEKTVFQLIRNVKPRSLITTPITAAFAAFSAFGAKRIGVLTPYISEVNKVVIDYICRHGFEVPVFASFNQDRDSVVAKISRHSIESAVYQLIDRSAVDVVFVSCTAIRMIEFCANLESDIQIPVTSSNHAMAWHALRLAGLDDQPEGLGSLYEKSISSVK